jgi:DNA-binding NarL/FixJ family response regulator
MKRVMVVDGHDRIRELLVELLSAEPDLQVVAACATGAQAVERAAEAQPDVVVLDPDLLGRDGVDATCAVLEKCPSAYVLVLTAAPHGRLAADVLAAGARACLAKSVAYTAILGAVRSA